MLLLLALCIGSATSHHVLFVHTLGTKSHLIQMAPLVQELAERGHQVTGIFFNTLKIEHENYKEIVVPYDLDFIMKEASKILMEKGGTSIFNPKMWVWSWNMWGEMMRNSSKIMFAEDGVTELLKSKPQVDVVVTFMHSGAFFAEYFDCPIIQFSPAGPFPSLLHGTGNIINRSVQPQLNLPFIEPMTFLQRLTNHIMISFMDWILLKVANDIHEVQKTIVEDIATPIEIAKRRQVMCIASSHYVTHGSWPYLPNVIEVGGLALKDPKPLPRDLETFMDSSPSGVVFVSFGSSLKPDQMPQDKLDIFVNAFRSLDMQVIWKWDAEVPNLPQNVKISSWLPQQDLLGHPNLKVFVTHGGLGSLVESIYHKAVIVGIPFSNDQKPNILRAVGHGYATSLDWDNFSAEELVQKIKQAMRNETMRAAMERIHNLYVDREEKPLDKAAWWVEYVCRHKGADMLRSAGTEDIPWYQYHHVDILIFLVIIIFSIVGGIYMSCKLCCNMCCSKKVKTE